MNSPTEKYLRILFFSIHNEAFSTARAYTLPENLNVNHRACRHLYNMLFLFHGLWRTN